MRKEKYRGEIDGQEVHTCDENLAHIYRDISMISKCREDADPPWGNITPDDIQWEETLTNITSRMKAFAEGRGIADNPLLLDVRRRLHLAQDIYDADNSDYATVKETLTECLADMQYIDEQTIGQANEKTGCPAADNPQPRQPVSSLLITETHDTRDMSVAGRYNNQMTVLFYDMQTPRPIEPRSLDCGRIQVVSLSEEEIVLSWGGKEYSVRKGERTVTKSYMIDNPYLSVDKIHLTFEYRDPTPSALTPAQEPPHEPTAAESERKATLSDLDRRIAEGAIEAYPQKALLAASDDWTTYRIVRHGLFRQTLLEGIDRGSLAPDCDTAWQWLLTAAENNDPACFMDDMERYYDLLATAAEEGNDIALDIMNSIWEPEQIIEED